MYKSLWMRKLHTQITNVYVYINIYKYIDMGDNQNRQYEWGSCTRKSRWASTLDLPQKLMALLQKSPIKETVFCKKTCNFKQAPNRRHPIITMTLHKSLGGRKLGEHIRSTSKIDGSFAERDLQLKASPSFRIQSNVLGEHIRSMGWLWLVGSLKTYVSFAEYSLFWRALVQTSRNYRFLLRWVGS